MPATRYPNRPKRWKHNRLAAEPRRRGARRRHPERRLPPTIRAGPRGLEESARALLAFLPSVAPLTSRAPSRERPTGSKGAAAVVSRMSWSVLACLLALSLGTRVASATAAGDPWSPGSNWLYLRGGYAKSSADGAGNGGAGYGFGFRHMMSASKVDEYKVLGRRPLRFLKWTLFNHWSLGGHVEYNVLGRFGAAEEIEVPAAIELTDHIMWKSVAKPYLT